MNTKQMEALLAVAETKSFTKAAKVLYMSQSNLSKIIMSLEDELQTKLFSKVGNKIELTTAGLVAQAQFTYTLEELRAMKSEIGKNDINRPALYIAISSSMNSARLLHPINFFMKEHPDVDIRLIESYSNLFENLLERGEVDLAIGWETGLNPRYFQSYLLDEDSWKLVVSRENPLAKYDAIDLSIAKNENFVVQRGDNRFIQLCQKAGFKPNIKHQVNSIEILVELISHNFGVGFLCSRMLPSSKVDSIKAITLNETSNHNLVILTKNEPRSALVREFIQFYASHYE